MTEIKTEAVAGSVDEFPGVGSTSPKRVRLPEDPFSLDGESWVAIWNEQELYVDHLENLARETELKTVSGLHRSIYPGYYQLLSPILDDRKVTRLISDW